MTSRAFPAVPLIVALALAGCSSLTSLQSDENAYANKPEAAVLFALGKPSDEFVGHYGNPPLDFRQKFTGEIKTLVFKKAGGEYYVSFEKRPVGWVGICSSWLPEGAQF